MTSPPVSEITPGEIHLWFVHSERIDDPELLSRYHRLMNATERRQQARFYFEKHRHQYLLTRALVRSVLSHYASGVPPERWRFKNNDYGKPTIANRGIEPALRFNLSHTDRLIVMAVTVGHEIGVDVEYLPKARDTARLARRVFSPSERQQLLALPRERRRDRFFDLWTLKEAYIKACGMGLSIPLDQFSYAFSDQGEITIAFEPERGDQPRLWRFWQILPGPDHKAAVAIKADEDSAFAISMWDLVPLSGSETVDYPLGHGRLVC